MRLRTVPLAALVLLAACGGGDPASPSDGGDPPTQLRAACTSTTVAGTGGLSARALCPVTGRYTSELTTLDAGAKGRFVYTSTWGRRGGASCTTSNCGNVVYVWRVDGATPGLVDSLVVDDIMRTTTTGDLQVSDDGALLVVATEPTGSLVTYSLADPAHPQLLSRFSTSNLANGVHTAQVSRVNGKLYAFCSIDPRNGEKARLAIVDLSDPRAPVEVWSRVMGNPFVHDVFVRDGWLLTAVWNDGMIVWDIGARGRGSPSAPDSVASLGTATGQIHNIWWMKDATGAMRWAFLGEEGPGTIGSSSEGDIHVVDMADPSKPREVAYYSVPGAGTHNFSVDERNGVLYAAYYNAGVRAIDVRGDLSSCTDAQKGTFGRCSLVKMGRELGTGIVSNPATGRATYVWGVEYAGSAVYASDMLGGLWVLDPVR
jgi:LVIVD repeat